MGDSKRDEQEKSTQSYAALGIGIICVVVGLPLWWKTTEVYRVQLPYGEISTLAHSWVKYQVNVEIISFVDGSDLSLLYQDVESQLQCDMKRMLQPLYSVSVREAVDEEKILIKQVTSLKDLDRKLTNLLGDKRNKYFVVLLKDSSKHVSEKPFVGHNRISYMKGSMSTTTIATLLRKVIVREDMVSKSLIAAKGSIEMKPDKESMRSLRSTPGYDMTFTLANPQPDILDVQWDIQGGINAYLKPFLSKLEKFADFTLTSQVLYFTGLKRRPQKNTETGESFYTEQDLPHLITPLESSLGSHTSNNPAINFLVYIPTRDQSPLYVKDSLDKPVPSNSFFSPRWGGILVYNMNVPPNSSLPHHVDVNMRQMMEVSGIDVKYADLENEAVTEWEVDAWLRSFCVENIAKSAKTLQSLAQLLGEISNIVIKDDIGTEVEKAVAAITESRKQLLAGELEEAFLSSKSALIASEKAFFDPSLLELLYFPEDQKFAIYIPLFLPISIPVLTSLLQAIKWMRNKRKQKTE